MTFARWLALAASPSFALMMMATLIDGDAASNTLCSATGVSSLGGMTTMYALMCLFHTQPWLRLIGAFQDTPVLVLEPRAVPGRLEGAGERDDRDRDDIARRGVSMTPSNLVAPGAAVTLRQSS